MLRFLFALRWPLVWRRDFDRLRDEKWNLQNDLEGKLSVANRRVEEAERRSVSIQAEFSRIADRAVGSRGLENIVHGEIVHMVDDRHILAPLFYMTTLRGQLECESHRLNLKTFAVRVSMGLRPDVPPEWVVERLSRQFYAAILQEYQSQSALLKVTSDNLRDREVKVS
jgi:hypothetical protein